MVFGRGDGFCWGQEHLEVIRGWDQESPRHALEVIQTQIVLQLPRSSRLASHDLIFSFDSSFRKGRDAASRCFLWGFLL